MYMVSSVLPFGALFPTYQSLAFYSGLIYNSSQTLYLSSKCGQAPIRMSGAVRVGRAQMAMEENICLYFTAKVSSPATSWIKVTCTTLKRLTLWQRTVKYMNTSASVKKEMQRCSADCQKEGNIANAIYRNNFKSTSSAPDRIQTVPIPIHHQLITLEH